MVIRSKAMNMHRFSAEPGKRRHEQRDLRAAGRSPRRSSRVAPRPDPPGDEGGEPEEADDRPPGDERRRLHARVVGEPRQRPEHPEQRGRAEDDRGSRRDGTAASIAAAPSVGPDAVMVGLDTRRHGRASPSSRAPRAAAIRPGAGLACRRTRSGAAVDSRRAAGPRRIDVNGTRISRKTSIETRKPANRKRTPRNLPELEQLRRAEAVEAVGDGRDERPDGDEDRRRHAAVDAPGAERPERAGQRRDEVDRDGDRRDEQVEQELVARLVAGRASTAGRAAWA